MQRKRAADALERRGRGLAGLFAECRAGRVGEVPEREIEDVERDLCGAHQLRRPALELLRFVVREHPDRPGERPVQSPGALEQQCRGLRFDHAEPSEHREQAKADRARQTPAA